MRSGAAKHSADNPLSLRTPNNGMGIGAFSRRHILCRSRPSVRNRGPVLRSKPARCPLARTGCCRSRSGLRWHEVRRHSQGGISRGPTRVSWLLGTVCSLRHAGLGIDIDCLVLADIVDDSDFPDRSPIVLAEFRFRGLTWDGLDRTLDCVLQADLAARDESLVDIEHRPGRSCRQEADDNSHWNDFRYAISPSWLWEREWYEPVPAQPVSVLP